MDDPISENVRAQLRSLPKKHLRVVANELNVRGRSRMNKRELIDALVHLDDSQLIDACIRMGFYDDWIGDEDIWGDDFGELDDGGTFRSGETITTDYQRQFDHLAHLMFAIADSEKDSEKYTEIDVMAGSLSVLTPDETEEQIFLRYYGRIGDWVCEYMKRAGLSTINVRYPEVLRESDGAVVDNRGINLTREDGIFLVRCSPGSGITFSYTKRTQQTIIDLIQDECGSELTETSSERISRELSSKGNRERIGEIVAEFLRQPAPTQYGGEDLRIVVDQSLIGYNLNASAAKKLINASLYFSEIVLLYKPFSCVENIDAELEFLARIKPLIQSRVVQPFYVDFYTDSWMHHWFWYYISIWTDYEKDYLVEFRKRWGDEEKPLFGEYAEVLSQELFCSDLFSGINVFSDKTLFEFGMSLAQEGIDFQELASEDHFSGIIFENLFLPALQNVSFEDLTSIRANEESFHAVRQDLQAIVNAVREEKGAANPFDTKVPELVNLLLDSRIEALERNLNRGKLTSRAKQGFLNVSAGAIVSYILTGDVATSLISGLTSQILGETYSQVRGSKSRNVDSALARFYGHLAFEFSP